MERVYQENQYHKIITPDNLPQLIIRTETHQTPKTLSKAQTKWQQLGYKTIATTKAPQENISTGILACTPTKSLGTSGWHIRGVL